MANILADYWLFVAIAAVIVAILLFLLLRPRQRVRLTDSAPVRPHMAYTRPPEGAGIVGEAATAVSNVTAEVIQAPVHAALHEENAVDDLCRIKGVGPRFAETLRARGFNSFEQLAQLTPTETERLDAELGAFRGRIARDRIVEQADYLARGDTDGFEERFGKL